MRVLGIDPGLNITGYGLLDDGGGNVTVLEAGVVRTKASDPMADRLREIAEEIEAFLRPHVQADPSGYRQGATDVPPIGYFNMRVRADQLRVISEPLTAADIEPLMDALSRKYREYPGMRAFAARGSIITSNDGGTRSINLDIAGTDLGEMYAVAQAAYLRAGEIFDSPRIQSQPSSLTTPWSLSYWLATLSGGQ